MKYGGFALEHMVSLNINYRCHKDLVEIPNALFYGSMIQSTPKDARSHPQAKFPLLFVCSSLTDEVNNEVEARLLLEQIQKFAVSGWPLCWGERKLKDIGVVTPSQTQVKLDSFL